jgi:uncharacterized protein (TIGR01777 family)
MRVLLAGGSGNVGQNLVPILESKGHEVWVLTRHPKNENDVFWNPSKNEISSQLSTSIDAVINLNGFSVSNRWTEKNKMAMRDSRVQSNDTLVQWFERNNIIPKVWINASAIGIYPSLPTVQDENSPQGKGFLAELCQEWESFQSKLSNDTRTVILRIGIVLHAHSGALPTLKIPFQFGLGSAIGDGKQYMSWIDMSDLCNMILFVLENNISGAVNAVSPEPVTNYDFSKTLAQVMHRPFWAPAVPGFIIRLVMGEMASMVLNSHRISSQKIISQGFEFHHPTLLSSLQHQFQS